MPARVICRKRNSVSRVFTDGRVYEEIGREGTLIVVADDFGHRRCVGLDGKSSPHLPGPECGKFDPYIGKFDPYSNVPVGYFEVLP